MTSELKPFTVLVPLTPPISRIYFIIQSSLQMLSALPSMSKSVLSGSGFRVVTDLSSVGQPVDGKHSESKTSASYSGLGGITVLVTRENVPDVLLGTARCVPASRFTEDPSLRVLVLESGGRSVAIRHSVLIFSLTAFEGVGAYSSAAYPLAFHKTCL